MPIFTMIFTFTALPFACILDKGMIEAVSMFIGAAIDLAIVVISEYKDSKKYKK